jgi:hypothetical protein
MKYKISETPLKLKEYGRNIQSMVEYAKTIEDKEKRTRVIHTIIRIMGNLNPSIKENPDYKQKLWDHVHLIGEFSLDVNSPYPVPSPEDLINKTPPKMSYFQRKPKFKQYGLNIDLMVDNAIAMPESERKNAYINFIANTMKQFLQSQNRGTPEDLIAKHIGEISEGKIKVKPEDIVLSKTPLAAPLKNTNGYTKKSRNNRNKNNGRNKQNIPRRKKR